MAVGMFSDSIHWREPPCKGCAAWEECSTGKSCRHFGSFIQVGRGNTPLNPEPSRAEYRKQFGAGD